MYLLEREPTLLLSAMWLTSSMLYVQCIYFVFYKSKYADETQHDNAGDIVFEGDRVSKSTEVSS